MRSVRRAGQFIRDLRLAERRGRNVTKLSDILDLLISGSALPAVRRDHGLQGGQWKGCRECHIEPDWLLIYRVTQDEVELLRTGTHSDLFG